MATTISVKNPITDEVIQNLAETAPGEVDRAFVRARRAQKSWSALGFTKRAALLRELARRIRDDVRLVTLLSAETGKPRYEAELFEVLYLLELTRFYTGRAGRNALRERTFRPFLFPNKRSRVGYHPLGVVAVIGPYNWPLLNNFADAIAPLLAGNAVLLKPSEYAPLTSLRVQELWNELGFPADVFQVVVGGAEIGRRLSENADMIFFTGSERTGREIARVAAERLVPTVLELGGKSAMLVLEDADLKRAADAAIWSSFANAGQICIRTERAYVAESVFERFVALCSERLDALRQGPFENEEEFDVGPLTLSSSRERLERLLEEATEAGATAIRRDDAKRDGNFFPPTLLVNVKDTDRIMREETFGPILPIRSVNDAEQAIELINAHPTGLAGSVWSKDLKRAREIARRIESGSVTINDTLAIYDCVEAPLGGIKASGHGFRHGAEALRQFCRVETILEDRPLLGLLSPRIARLFGFPYETRVLDFMRRLMKAFY